MGNRFQKSIAVVFLVCLLGTAWPAGAQYSTGAYSELEAEDTTIDKISDWFATLGMTEEQKAVAKARRRAARKFKKNQQAIEKKRKEILKKKKQAMRGYKQRN